VELAALAESDAFLFWLNTPRCRYFGFRRPAAWFLPPGVGFPFSLDEEHDRRMIWSRRVVKKYIKHCLVGSVCVSAVDESSAVVRTSVESCVSSLSSFTLSLTFVSRWRLHQARCFWDHRDLTPALGWSAWWLQIHARVSYWDLLHVQSKIYTSIPGVFRATNGSLFRYTPHFTFSVLFSVGTNQSGGRRMSRGID